MRFFRILFRSLYCILFNYYRIKNASEKQLLNIYSPPYIQFMSVIDSKAITNQTAIQVSPWLPFRYNQHRASWTTLFIYILRYLVILISIASLHLSICSSNILIPFRTINSLLTLIGTIPQYTYTIQLVTQFTFCASYFIHCYSTTITFLYFRRMYAFFLLFWFQ